MCIRDRPNAATLASSRAFASSALAICSNRLVFITSISLICSPYKKDISQKQQECFLKSPFCRSQRPAVVCLFSAAVKNAAEVHNNFKYKRVLLVAQDDSFLSDINYTKSKNYLARAALAVSTNLAKAWGSL